MRIARDQAISIAVACAKANPPSYFSVPFTPHDWVVDAIMLAAARMPESPMDGSIHIHRARELLAYMSGRRDVLSQSSSVVNGVAASEVKLITDRLAKLITEAATPTGEPSC